jgi:hypothetical protein
MSGFWAVPVCGFALPQPALGMGVNPPPAPVPPAPLLEPPLPPAPADVVVAPAVEPPVPPLLVDDVALATVADPVLVDEELSLVTLEAAPFVALVALEVLAPVVDEEVLVPSPVLVEVIVVVLTADAGAAVSELHEASTSGSDPAMAVSVLRAVIERPMMVECMRSVPMAGDGPVTMLFCEGA